MAVLGNLIEQIRGVSYKPEDLHATLEEDSVILLRANNIKDGSLNFEDVVFVDKKKVSDKQLLKAGDILICASSGSKELVGKAAYVECDLQMTFGAFCKAVRPKTECPKYIGHFFNSPYYRERISNSAAGANINNIRNEHIDALEITWPSLEKQRDATEVLDKVSEMISLRKEQLAKLDQLVKSRFIELFENKGFPNVLFEDVCVFLRNGANIKQTKGAGGYPITRIETLSNDVFNCDRLGYADITDLSKYENFVLKSGDLLISHINSVAYLGRTVQYKGQMATPVIHGMNLLCCRVSSHFNPTYVEWFMRTPMAKDYISSITKKAVNQASMTTSDLKKMALPKPPIELQNQYAAFVKQTDKSKLAIQQSRDKLETLKKSLMQEYFG